MVTFGKGCPGIQLSEVRSWQLIGMPMSERIYPSRLTVDDSCHRLEDLKIECQQGAELGVMVTTGVDQAIDEGLFERRKLRIVPSMQTPPVLAA